MDKRLADLAVVIPVYNEEKNIRACIESWLRVLTGLEIHYLLIVLNDGSRDKTEQVLSEFSQNKSIQIVNKANEGHGPTILRGYHIGAGLAEWVFQIDSDNELPAETFHTFWDARHDKNAVLGFRGGREQSVIRKIISRTAKITTSVLYKCHHKDVNIPYRLIRSDDLIPILSHIPHDTFAPNIAISGALAKTGASVSELPVPFEPRAHGVASLTDFSAFTNAVISLIQLVRISRSFS